MKAARWYGKGDIRFEEIPEPECGPGEVKIRVAYAGICGSDLHIYNRGMFLDRLPMTMGHEFSGIVTEVGNGVEDFHPGEAVTANPMVGCGHCDSCRSGEENTCENLGFIGEVRPGAAAEYIVLPAEKVIRVPVETGRESESVSETDGKTVKSEHRMKSKQVLAETVSETDKKNVEKTGSGTGTTGRAYTKKKAEKEESLNVRSVSELILQQLALAEPLAVALNLCERADLRPEDEIAIIGAGPIGLLSVLVAEKIYGVKKIMVSGRSEFRLDLAERLGADAAGKLPEGSRFPKILEAAGKQATFDQVLEHVMPGGTVCVVSVFEDLFPVDLNRIVGAQITIKGCNAYERRHLEKAVAVIADGTLDVSPLITRIFDLEECREAFEFLNQKEKKAAKVLFAVNGGGTRQQAPDFQNAGVSFAKM